VSASPGIRQASVSQLLAKAVSPQGETDPLVGLLSEIEELLNQHCASLLHDDNEHPRHALANMVYKRAVVARELYSRGAPRLRARANERHVRVDKLLGRAEKATRGWSDEPYWRELWLAILRVRHVHNLVTDTNARTVSGIISPLVGGFILEKAQSSIAEDCAKALTHDQTRSMPSDDISAAAEE
jgi:hypothetical protein